MQIENTDIIKSKDNPTIKLYKKLADSKKERKNYDMFVLEGLRLVIDAIAEGAEISKILITETALQKYGEEFLQADLKKVKPLIISNELGMKISSTEKTQGVFGICHTFIQKDLNKSLKQNGRYIILYQLQDPGNVGMIIRTADAMGIDGIILSESCDLFSPKVIRSTMGSIFRVPLWYDIDVSEIMLALESNNIETVASVIDSSACDIKEHSFENGGAVFIGNEGNGLPENLIRECDKLITIKMQGNINSLNAGMATGLIMWEMKR